MLVALRNRGIARLEAGAAVSALGAWTFSIALALYAYYEQGPGGVALAVAVRMVPAALFSPLADRLAAPYSLRNVLAATALTRAAALGAIALVAANELPFALLLGLAAVYELAASVARTARSAMLPVLARTPAELSIAAAGRLVDYTGFLAGGAATAVLLASGASLHTAFAVAAAIFLVPAALAALLPPAPGRGRGPAATHPGIAALPATIRHPWMRMRLGLYGASTLVESMLELLLVITALDVLTLGDDGVGWLRVALAAGGIAGAVGAIALLRSRRLTMGLTTGLVLAGVPLALVAAWPRTGFALVLLALLGVGYALAESALLLLSQRTATAADLTRVASAEELVHPLARAAGTGVAAQLVVQLGDREALVVAGVLLPLIAIVSVRAAIEAERSRSVPEAEYKLLRALPVFAKLPPATVETLALCATPERFSPHDPIDPCRFHAIEAGTVELSSNGGAPRELRPGECLGELALIRETAPDDAQAIAREEVAAITIDRRDFMTRVSGVSRRPAPAAPPPRRSPTTG